MRKKITLGLLCLLAFIPCTRLLSCTAFYVVRGELILAGNNEDWFNPKTKMWFVTSTNGDFGRVYFGFDNFWQQGGMNEKGLFFDGFATEPLEVLNSLNKPIFKGNLVDHVMATCATIEEVIEVFKKYNLKFFKRGMFMFGDAFGKSVIIEGDDFVIKKGDYQVCTNFYQSKTNPVDIDCWRFLKVDKVLKANPIISVDLCKNLLKAAHVDLTQYSNVYDLKNKIVYLYHFHNFDQVVKIDLLSELRKGQQSFDIASLFPENLEFKQRFRKKTTPVNNKFLYILLLACAMAFLIAPFIVIVSYKKYEIMLRVETKLNRRYFFYIRLVMSITCILMVMYLLALSQYPQIFTSGLPQSTAGFSLIQKTLIRIPALSILLTFALIVLLVISRKRDIWNPFLRFFYFSVTIVLLIVFGLFGYWGLIKIF